MSEFESRLDMVATNAWETWTNNGLGLDADMRYQTLRNAIDIANNAYGSDMTDQEWLDATLARLREISGDEATA